MSSANQGIIGSGNALSPEQCQSISWTNAIRWMHRKKFHWNLNQNEMIFIQENSNRNVVWKIASISFRHNVLNTKTKLTLIIPSHINLSNWFNSLWPNEAIWWHHSSNLINTGSPLNQCCPTVSWTLGNKLFVKLRWRHDSCHYKETHLKMTAK